MSPKAHRRGATRQRLASRPGLGAAPEWTLLSNRDLARILLECWKNAGTLPECTSSPEIHGLGYGKTRSPVLVRMTLQTCEEQMV
mmetsp:Transcript_136595/g.308638  ORF Transcript_136595/g.308638 Transcript_136595/m.308638 type:complete len:85 (-) Transcript_136595:558-812(-)